MKYEKFNPKTLIVAREVRGLSQTELSEKINYPQSAVSKIENGNQYIDEEFLKKIIEELDFPESFFFQEMEIYPPNLHYRKKADTTPKLLAFAEGMMNIYRNNIQTLLRSVELPFTNLPLFDEKEKTMPQDAARYLREFWKIPKGAIENLTKIVEDKGVVVIMMDYTSDKIDGRSMVTSTGQYIIFLNDKLSGDRLRWTLSHELGHIVLHLYSPNVFEVDIEREASLFASEFLMPEKEIKPQLSGSKLTIQKLADLKRYWKVSMQAIVYWAETIKAITKNQARYLWSQFITLRIKIKEPIDIPVEKPSLLKEVLAAFIEQLGYTQEELSKTLNITINFFKSKYLTDEKFLLKVVR